tara:strand:+ start:1280 stop:2632 length:1353 start_codon:yes stop_codon:yes gene_type:complete
MNTKIIMLFIVLNGNIFSNEIPESLFDNVIKEVKFDAGLNWENNSLFYGYRYNLFDLKLSHNTKNSIFGIRSSKKQNLFYSYNTFKLKHNFNIYLNYFISDEIKLNEGDEKKIFSFESITGLRFSNKWLYVSYGKGAQGWGTNYDITLGVNQDSEPYDYGVLGLDFGYLKVNYFHGFLEQDTVINNRFINGRGLELTNKKSAIIGFSEIVIYSGNNRSVDFSYFNPISTHLEIELNERTNLLGSGSGNGIWQLYVDFFIASNIRISCNYLIDEFIIDQEQINEKKASGRAYSYKVVYSPKISSNQILSLYFSKINIGTYTFRHQLGSNNFVQSGKPLGSILGSDCIENKVGVRYMASEKFLITFNFGQLKIGENSINDTPNIPYTDYTIVPFPSGDYQKVVFLSQKFQFHFKNIYSLTFEIRHENRSFIGNNIKNSSFVFFGDFNISFNS